jgi:hypothetical protein
LTRPQVLNRRNLGPAWQDDPRLVYVGRPSPWGNPYHETKLLGRSEVVEMFRMYAVDRLEREPYWLDSLLGATALVCFCAPQACHADVLAELVEQIRNVRGLTTTP